MNTHTHKEALRIELNGTVVVKKAVEGSAVVFTKKADPGEAEEEM